MYEAEGLTGTVTLVPGSTNKAVLEFRRSDTPDPLLGSNLVVTMADHEIVSMIEYRRTSKAHRVAGVA